MTMELRLRIEHPKGTSIESRTLKAPLHVLIGAFGSGPTRPRGQIARDACVASGDLEEGDSQGLPVWSRHVGDSIIASNLTRRVDSRCS
jgi:hypothetical protein